MHRQRPERRLQLAAHPGHVHAELPQQRGVVTGQRAGLGHDPRDLRPRGRQVQPTFMQDHRGRVRPVREHPKQQMLIPEIGMTQTIAFDLRQAPDLQTGGRGPPRHMRHQPRPRNRPACL